MPVRFGDIDQAGIAYYPTLIDHCHDAFEEFFEMGLGIPYPTTLLRDRLGFPMVHLEADFRRPLRFGDVLEMEVTVARIGRTSITFRYRAFVRRGRRPPGGEPAFEVRATTVCLDMRTFRPKPPPPRYRRMLERHLSLR